MSAPMDTRLGPLPRVDDPWVDARRVDEGYDEGWSEPTRWTPHGPVEREDEPRRGSRLPGLDGLRAIAVTAVVLFHLDPSLLPGGFLGVDLFFVISGFLITRLLLVDVAATGAVRRGRFYRRRGRRLLPAVAVLLLVVYLAGTLIWRSELPTLRGSLLSSLGYVTNWWLIFDHQSYFAATGRPPMLQHLWSLAVEEQYYLLWPAVIVALTAAARRRGTNTPPEFRRLALVALLLALASTGAMAVVAIHTDVPYATDSSRVHFGTDTHGMGLLLGSAVAAWTAADQRRRPLAPRGNRLIDLAAAAGLTVLLWQFTALDQYTAGLYRGGLLLVNVLAAAVVWAVARPSSRTGRLLDRPLLRGLGQRSYAIYLWHWPVVVVTRPGLDVHGPSWLINTARVVIILVLADASYRFVERPLRAGAWHRTAAPTLSGTPLSGTPLSGTPLSGTTLSG
ncbi:MAG: acyltransferase, partial [bacterium]